MHKYKNKNMYKNIGIITKNDDVSKNAAKQFVANLPQDISFEYINCNSDCLPCKVDLIVVFGGDGTFLTSLCFAFCGASFVSVNTGNLGFLSSYDKNEIPNLIAAIQNNRLVFEKKCLYSASFKKDTVYFLNEVTVQREVCSSSRGGTVKLSLYANDKFLTDYNADGIIVCSPTGSTAYSLSAGGAILSPELNAIAVTPLCSHSLYAKPIVFCDKTLLKITNSAINDICGIFADGKYVGEALPQEDVIVKKSKKYINLAKGKDFFDKLNNKLLMWGGRS